MIKLNNNNIILNFEEFNSSNLNVDNSNILYIDNIKCKRLNVKKICQNNFKIFKIDFNNDFNFEKKALNYLYKILISGYKFGIKYKGYNLVGIINNYQNYNNNVNNINEIEIAFKAMYIQDLKSRYEYLFDNICDYLDSLWAKYNPCKFENNICIASRNGMTAHKYDGCCYVFYYSKDPFCYIEGTHKCKYLDPIKHCTMPNITDKIFVCKFLKDEKLFNIDIDKIFLIQVFFNKYQKLAITTNFFITKDQFISKLMTESTDRQLYLLYFLHHNYLFNKTTPKDEYKNFKKYHDEINIYNDKINNFTFIKRRLKRKVNKNHKKTKVA